MDAAIGFLFNFIGLKTSNKKNNWGNYYWSSCLVTIIGSLLGLIEFNGIVSPPPDLSPIFMKLDILGALDLAMISIIISFLFVNLFDTAGTLLGVASRANLIEDSGKIKYLDKALKADILQVSLVLLGCSPVTSYV